MRWRRSVLALLASSALVSGAAGGAWLVGGGDARSGPAADGDGGTERRVLQTLLELPLRFEPNVGQTAAPVKFLARASGYVVYLTGRGAVLGLDGGGVMRVRFAGAREAPDPIGLDRLTGTVNYFLGGDPRAWHTRIPTYGKVLYPDLYPGIDLLFYGNHRRVEHDFVVSPGADPGAIVLAITGAGRMEVDPGGDLVLRTASGEVRWRRPLLYQEVGGVRRLVSGGYELLGAGRVGFRVGPYDRARPLVIDPVVVYATYLGGTGAEEGTGIAADASGNAYVTGTTASTDFPTAGAAQGANAGGVDTFVTKLDPSGQVVYSTYLGGAQEETPRDIAVDGAGNAYAAGSTASTNFPTTAGAFQTVHGGGIDAYVTKLDPSGQVVFSTFLGGSNGEGRVSVEVDGSGAVYLSGFTLSKNDFPTKDAIQPALAGLTEAFLSKLNPEGTGLVYSTYLGGSHHDTARCLAVDPDNNAYVAGWTLSTNFPTVNAFQLANGGDFDFFVLKVNPAGSALVYSSYMGGTSRDNPYVSDCMDVDAAGNAYVSGLSKSTNFPVTAGAFQTALKGTQDGAVFKVSPAGALLYATYLGSSGDDDAPALAVTSSGFAVVTGFAGGTDFPLVDPTDGTKDGQDAFVTQLTPEGDALVFSTFLGGSVEESGKGIAVDPFGTIYVTGLTKSSDFPTASPAQGTYGGVGDAFVAKIELGLAPPTITSGPADPTTSTEATFEFTHPDPTVGFECDLDGGGFVACTSPVTYTGLADGSHTFSVRALKGAEVSAPATSTWTVDTTMLEPPTITSGPANPTTSTEATFEFTHPDPTVGFECDLDGGGFVACTSPATYTGLAPGSHTFSVRALKGAEVSAPATSTWTVSGDATPPTVSLSRPSTDQLLTDRLVKASWTGTDDTGIVRYDLYERVGTTGSQLLVQSGTATSYSLTGDPGQTYCYQVFAFDAVGNQGVSEERCAAVPHDDRSAAVTYAGAVSQAADAKAFEGTVTVLDGAGAEATLSCTCRKVGVLARKDAASGIMEVWVDGVLDRTVDLYSANTKSKVYVYTSALSWGPHTVRVVWTGTRNASSTGTALALDGIAVIQ